MIFWLLDMRCGACEWSERGVHPVGERLDYACPRCKTPVMAYRLIGPVRFDGDAGGLEVAA